MLRIFSTHRLFTFLLTGLMITSCGGGTSSNTPSTGTSSKTSSSSGGTTPVTPITSNTTPRPQRNDYTSQCNATDFACIVTQTSKWSQDSDRWLQALRTEGSGGTTGTNPNPIIDIRRRNAADTYADCARIGDPSLNCDLDLRGVP